MSRGFSTTGAASRAIAIVLCAFALIVVVGTLDAVLEYRFFMPYWDTTELWRLYFAAKDDGTMWTLPLSGIPAPEQRLIPAVWFFFLDLWLVQGRGTVMIIGNLAFLAMALVAVLWSCHRRLDLRSSHGATAGALICAPVFSAVHIAAARPVFVWQYAQIAACFVAFVAAASFDANRDDADKASTNRLLVGVGVGNSIAPFLWGSGFAGWGATLALALVRRWPARVVGALSAGATATIALFALAAPFAINTGGTRLAELDAIAFSLHAFNQLANPLALALSSLVEQTTAQTIAQVATLAALIAIARCIGEWLRRPDDRPDHFACTALQILLFCAGAAVLTALARVHLGPEQAFSQRYSFRMIWAWAMLAGLWVSTAPQSRRFRRAAIAAATMLALMAPAQVAGISRLQGAAAHLRPAYAALITGVRDEPILERVFPEPSVLVDVAARLRAERLGVFSMDAAGWLGGRLEDDFSVRGRALPGNWRASRIATDPSATRLEGECEVGAVRPRWLVVVSPDGIVRGLGATRPAADPSVSRLHWQAYVPTTSPLEGYRVYLLDTDAGVAWEVEPDAGGAQN